MKTKYLILLFTLYFSGNLNAQSEKKLLNEQLYEDSLYENKKEDLLKSMIILIDSANQKELINRIKNWSGINFANSKEVLVSETESQLVFNYIDKSFYIKSLMTINIPWYIRLVVQVKDKKVRLLFYDDGNSFMPGDGGYTGSLSARTYKLRNYLKEDENGQLVARKMNKEGLLNLINSIESTANSIVIALNTKSDNNKEGDW